MVKVYLKLIVVVVGAMMGLSVAAASLGSMTPPNTALDGFRTNCEDKPAPCWFGIVPGITTEEEVYELMTVTGARAPSRQDFSQAHFLVFTLPQPWPYCNAIFGFNSEILFRIELSLCREPHIQVGDVTTLWANQKIIMSLPPDEMVYGEVSMNIDGWPTPYGRVSFITLFSPYSQFQPYPWYGFVPQDRYCSLVPTFPRCRNLRR